MSCATPEGSPRRLEPASPQTPGSSGSRSNSRARILSGGLWRSAGSLVIDEAESGEWCARSDEPNRCTLPRCVCAAHVQRTGSPCVCVCVHMRVHWYTPHRMSLAPHLPQSHARGSGALWKHTGPVHAPLGTAGIFERLFFRLNEEQQVLVYYSDDHRLNASRNRPLGTIPLSGGAVSVFDAQPDHAFCFVLDVPSPPAKRSSYLLAGDSQAERVQWMAALSRHGVLPRMPQRARTLDQQTPGRARSRGRN